MFCAQLSGCGFECRRSERLSLKAGSVISYRRNRLIPEFRLHFWPSDCLVTPSCSNLHPYKNKKQNQYYTVCVNWTSHCLLPFYSARNACIASAVLGIAIPSVCLSVCLSVCPSHAGIVSKRRHVARCSLHRWIAKCV